MNTTQAASWDSFDLRVEGVNPASWPAVMLRVHLVWSGHLPTSGSSHTYFAEFRPHQASFLKAPLHLLAWQYNSSTVCNVTGTSSALCPGQLQRKDWWTCLHTKCKRTKEEEQGTSRYNNMQTQETNNPFLLNQEIKSWKKRNHVSEYHSIFNICVNTNSLRMLALVHVFCHSCGPLLIQKH